MIDGDLSGKRLTAELGSRNGEICIVHDSPGDDKSLWLKLVHGPLSRLMKSNRSIFDILDEHPTAGEEELNREADLTRNEIARAKSDGFDGFCYVVNGAYPAISSPMQYGGHFLEVDRMLLDEAEGQGYRAVFVQGSDEPYVDFVSDLPCEILGWDIRSGIEPAQVKEMRSGLLMADHPDAEIGLMIFDNALSAQVARAL